MASPQTAPRAGRLTSTMARMTSLTTRARVAFTFLALCTFSVVASGCGATPTDRGLGAAADTPGVSYQPAYHDYSSDGLGTYEYILEPNDLNTAAVTKCFTTLQHQPGSVVNTLFDPARNIVYRVDVEDLATFHYEPAATGQAYLPDTSTRRWGQGLDIYLSFTLQVLSENPSSGYSTGKQRLVLRVWPRDAERQVPLHASDVVSTLNANFYIILAGEPGQEELPARADQLLRELASCTPQIIRSIY